MSHSSLRARKLALAGLASLTLLGGAASAAQANFTTSLTESCVFPYTGQVPLSVSLDAQIPASWPAGTTTDRFPVTITATGSAPRGIGASLDGAVRVKGSVVAPDGTATPLDFTPNPTLKPLEDPLSLTTIGAVPPFAVTQGGSYTVRITSVGLLARAYDFDGNAIAVPPTPGTIESDTDPLTFDVACAPAPGQDTTLALITVTGPESPLVTGLSPNHGPATGGNQVTITGSGFTATTSVRFGSAPAEVVSRGGSKSIVVKAPAGTSYSTVDVVAATATGSTANTVADDYTYDRVTDDAVNYPYTLAGSATLKTLVKGSIPLTGSLETNFSPADGGFTATLRLKEADANLTALGFLPVTAKVAVVPTAPVTGSLVKGVLNANAKVRIKLPSVQLFGLQLGGSSCQTKSISSINLKSTDPFFYPTRGGAIAGTFATSDLTGCGSLNGILSSLTKGNGNALVLNLAPLVAIPATS